jgi:4-amino-4-deoxy-L-arabinose transferase-like glycosyltransferase
MTERSASRSDVTYATAGRNGARRRVRRDYVIALIIGLAGFALYAATAAPSVATLFDDSLEFQVVLPTLGIAHPSGYPLYTLLGKLFTLLLPFRDPAGRVNLLSALCAGAALAVLYLLAQKVAGNRAAAATATILFALSPAWWSQATIAEVYALHGLFVVLFLYLLLRWEEARIQDSGVRGQGTGIRGQGSASTLASQAVRLPASSDRWLAAAALVFGLGMTHHRMIALMLPAALVFIFWTDPGLIRQPRRWVAPLLCAVVPLFLYLYLAIRGQSVTSLDGAFVPTLTGTLDWVTARGYSIFLTGNPFGVARSASTVIALFLDQLGVLTIAAAGMGLVTAWKFSRRRYVFLLLATISQVAFASAYKVQDVEVFFLPAFMLTAVWAAWGLAPLFDGLALRGMNAARRLRPSPGVRSLIVTGWVVSLAVVMLFEPVRNTVQAFPEQNRRTSWGVYDLGADMLASVAPGGQVIGLLGETTLVRYFRDVLGQRADVEVVAADAEAARFAAVDAALAAGKPVYLTRDLPGAAGRYSLDAAGPLIAVTAKATPGPVPTGQPVGAGILLADARTEVRHPHASPVVRLALTWAAAQPISEELKVSARLVDAAGNVLVADDRVPVNFTYPTTAWVPGEPVMDIYDLPLPAGAPGGDFSPFLILYRAADGSEVGRVQLPPVTVPR